MECCEHDMTIDKKLKYDYKSDNGPKYSLYRNGYESFTDESSIDSYLDFKSSQNGKFVKATKKNTNINGLQPFLHQVGGHLCLLKFDKETVCKPIQAKEKEFYKYQIPKELLPFVAKYYGLVEVVPEVDKDGYVNLVVPKQQKSNQTFSSLQDISQKSDKNNKSLKKRLKSDQATISDKYSSIKVKVKCTGSLEVLDPLNLNLFEKVDLYSALKCYNNNNTNNVSNNINNNATLFTTTIPSTNDFNLQGNNASITSLTTTTSKPFCNTSQIYQLVNNNPICITSDNTIGLNSNSGLDANSNLSSCTINNGGSLKRKSYSFNPWSLKRHREQILSMQKDKHASYKFIRLQDLTAQFAYPCVLDLKMGTRQYGDDATEQKKISQIAKCEASTSASLGVRICGMQVYQPKVGAFMCYDKYIGRKLSVQGFIESLALFFQTNNTSTAPITTDQHDNHENAQAPQQVPKNDNGFDDDYGKMNLMSVSAGGGLPTPDNSSNDRIYYRYGNNMNNNHTPTTPNANVYAAAPGTISGADGNDTIMNHTSYASPIDDSSYCKTPPDIASSTVNTPPTNPELTPQNLYKPTSDCNNYNDNNVTTQYETSNHPETICKTNQLQNEIVSSILDQLIQLRAIIASLPTYRFYSSSLLILYEGDPLQQQTNFGRVKKSAGPKTTFPLAKIYMVDFAHSSAGYTKSTEPDAGYLFGLDSLIDIIKHQILQCE